MPATVDQFFDVISPFAYLQLERFGALQQANDVIIHPRPLVSGAILHHWRQKGLVETGAKRVFTYRYALFRTQQLGIPFRMPPAHPSNPIKALWLTITMGGSFDTVRTVLRHIRRDCNDVASSEGFATLCEAVGFAEGAAAVKQLIVKDVLRAHTDAAIALGAFGMPTLVHEGELSQGKNAIAIFLQNLRADWLSTPEVQCVNTLPVGIQRG